MTPRDHGNAARRHAALRVLPTAVACTSAGIAAQDYPARALRLVAPCSPGGTSDYIGRLLAQKITESWKQTVVVENRGGANGNIGTELVAKSAPVGRTLLHAARAIAINQCLYPQLPFDAVHDFVPVTTLLTQSLVLTVHPSLPAKSAGQFLALARARPGELNNSSGGSGDVNQVAAEQIQRTGADVAPSSLEAFAARVRADVRNYAELIRTAGIRVD